MTPETLRDLRDLYTRNLEMDAAQMVAFLKALIDEMDNFIILSRSKDERAGKNANPNTDTSFDRLRMRFLNVMKEAVR